MEGEVGTIGWGGCGKRTGSAREGGHTFHVRCLLSNSGGAAANARDDVVVVASVVCMFVVVVVCSGECSCTIWIDEAVIRHRTKVARGWFVLVSSMAGLVWRRPCCFRRLSILGERGGLCLAPRPLVAMPHAAGDLARWRGDSVIE